MRQEVTVAHCRAAWGTFPFCDPSPGAGEVGFLCTVVGDLFCRIGLASVLRKEAAHVKWRLTSEAGRQGRMCEGGPRAVRLETPKVETLA